MLKKALLVALCCLGFAACGADPKAATKENFQHAIEVGLTSAPAVCEDGFVFPRTYFMHAQPVYFPREGGVTHPTIQENEQNEALARAGLVRYVHHNVTGYHYGTIFAPPQAGSEPVLTVDLSASGLLAAQPGTGYFFNDPQAKAYKICYGKWAIDHVINFTEPGDLNGQHVTQVTYASKVVDVAAWALRRDVQAAFPVIAQTLAPSEKTATLVLTNDGWEPLK